MSQYYRPPKNTNPKWYGLFTEQIEAGEPPEEVLDEICELACGINPYGASDTCMKYARHIHTHLMAAFKVGQISAQQEKEDK